MNNNQNSWAIYIRSATGNAESLQEQKDICEKFLQNMSQKPTSITVYEDEKANGNNIERPGIQRLIQDIKDGKIDRVIVSSFHRLSRSLAVFQSINEEIFEQYNASLVSTTESFDSSTLTGKFALKMLQIFTRWETRAHHNTKLCLKEG